MSNMMNYKGYLGTVAYDADDRLFHGQVINTQVMITFHGQSVDELEEAFHTAIEDYLAWCAERGKEPEKPYSGRILIRATPEVHRDAALAARMRGQSLNAWATKVIEKAAKEQSTTR